MRVERFSLFFPPSVVEVKRARPSTGSARSRSGGFVKITGMNPEEELPPDVAPRAYYHAAGLEADRRDRRGPGGEHR